MDSILLWGCTMVLSALGIKMVKRKSKLNGQEDLYLQFGLFLGIHQGNTFVS